MVVQRVDDLGRLSAGHRRIVITLAIPGKFPPGLLWFGGAAQLTSGEMRTVQGSRTGPATWPEKR